MFTRLSPYPPELLLTWMGSSSTPACFQGVELTFWAACRYLPAEVMNGNYGRLDKADMFSLGLTLYQLATGVDPPESESSSVVVSGSLCSDCRH